VVRGGETCVSVRQATGEAHMCVQRRAAGEHILLSQKSRAHSGRVLRVRVVRKKINKYQTVSDAAPRPRQDELRLSRRCRVGFEALLFTHELPLRMRGD